MGKITKKQDQDDFENFRSYRAPQQNHLSEHELVLFDAEIESFKVEKEVIFPTEMRLRVFDEVAWLKAKGALNERGAIVMHDFKKAKYSNDGTKLLEPYDCRPILFEQLQEDLQQYWKWKSRKEYGETKRLEGLEELAKTMSITH